MSDRVDALDRLLSAAAAEVERAIRRALGLPPPDDLVELFSWHDGVDNDRRVRDSAGTGFARSVECADTALRGRVYDVYWHPPIDDPKEPRFLSLTHLVRSVVRRFEANGYWWDNSLRFLQERNDVLENPCRLEQAEVQTGRDPQ